MALGPIKDSSTSRRSSPSIWNLVPSGKRRLRVQRRPPAPTRGPGTTGIGSSAAGRGCSPPPASTRTPNPQAAPRSAKPGAGHHDREPAGRPTNCGRPATSRWDPPAAGPLPQGCTAAGDRAFLATSPRVSGPRQASRTSPARGTSSHHAGPRRPDQRQAGHQCGGPAQPDSVASVMSCASNPGEFIAVVAISATNPATDSSSRTAGTVQPQPYSPVGDGAGRSSRSSYAAAAPRHGHGHQRNSGCRRSSSVSHLGDNNNSAASENLV